MGRIPVTVDDVNVGIWFVLQIDDQSLGSFNTCEGLSCQIEVEQRAEGGNNGHLWQLPSRMTYSNVVLSRPLGPDTGKIGRWLAGMTGQLPVRRQTARIEALNFSGAPVGSWGLLDVIPVRWSGPSFSTDDTRILTESVEIAHHGFINLGM